MFHHQYEIILTVKKSIIFLTKNSKVEGRRHLLSFWRRQKGKASLIIRSEFYKWHYWN